MPCSSQKVERTPSTSVEAPAHRAFHAFLQFLAQARLTATDQRVLIYLVDRFVRHRTLSQTLPLSYIAEKLQVSENTVSRAFAHLTDAGQITRTAVLHRGAPTRTTLRGVTGALVQAQCGGIDQPHKPAAPQLRLVSLSGHHDDHRQMITVEEKNRGTGSEPPLPKKKPDQATGDGTQSSQGAKQGRKFRFDPSVQKTMTAKLPDGFLYDITNRGVPKNFTPDPAWNLTDLENEHLLALLASYRKQSRIRPVKTAPPRPSSPTLPKDIASLAWQSYPVLESLASPKKARVLMDEIGYSVAHANLGHGDTKGGIRAALSMIRKGRWGRPKGMLPTWNGAVLRSMGASHG